MRRAIFWTFTLAIVFAIQMAMANRAAAQQIFDPTPIGDEPNVESELPLPPQAADIDQRAKDFSRAFLGVTFDPGVRDAAVARSVTAGSPADQSGVRAGDTIVSLNGRKIRAHDEVLKIVAALRPGDVLDIEISRRVSVRARAVLDGQPVGDERVSGYRVEQLPAPVVYQNRSPVNRAQPEANTTRSRANYNAPQSRSNNVNRNDSNDDDRGDRVRGRLPRRRG